MSRFAPLPKPRRLTRTTSAADDPKTTRARILRGIFCAEVAKSGSASVGAPSRPALGPETAQTFYNYSCLRLLPRQE